MKHTGRSEENIWIKIIRSLAISSGIGIILCAGLMAVAAWGIVSLHSIPKVIIPALIVGIIAGGVIGATMLNKMNNKVVKGIFIFFMFLGGVGMLIW